MVGGPDLLEVEERVDSRKEGAVEPTTTLRDEFGDGVCVSRLVVVIYDKIGKLTWHISLSRRLLDIF